MISETIPLDVEDFVRDPRGTARACIDHVRGRLLELQDKCNRLDVLEVAVLRARRLTDAVASESQDIQNWAQWLRNSLEKSLDELDQHDANPIVSLNQAYDEAAERLLR